MNTLFAYLIVISLLGVILALIGRIILGRDVDWKRLKKASLWVILGVALFIVVSFLSPFLEPNSYFFKIFGVVILALGVFDFFQKSNKG